MAGIRCCRYFDVPNTSKKEIIIILMTLIAILYTVGYIEKSNRGGGSNRRLNLEKKFKVQATITILVSRLDRRSRFAVVRKW